MKCLAALAFVLAAAASPAQEADGAALLRQVSETYKKIIASRTFHFESEIRQELTAPDHGSWSRYRVVLAAAGEDRMRFEASGSMMGVSLVSDGRTLWVSSAPTREYTTVEYQPGKLMEIKGGGQGVQNALRRMKADMDRLGKLSDDVKSAKVRGTEALTVGDASIPCTVVEAEYDPPRGAADIVTSFRRILWIDPRRHIVLQEESATMGTLSPSTPFEMMETRSRTTYKVASVDRPESAVFAYRPPDTFRYVDTLTGMAGFGVNAARREIVGKPAPELSGTTLDGRKLSLSDLRGKVVLLDFWATWCGPCRTQMPQIAKLHAAMKGQDAIVLGVNDDEEAGKARDYLKENGYEWTHLFNDKALNARQKFKVNGIPTMVLLDREGKVVEYQVGSGGGSEEEIRKALRQLGIRID